MVSLSVGRAEGMPLKAYPSANAMQKEEKRLLFIMEKKVRKKLCRLQACVLPRQGISVGDCARVRAE